jgi:hypothetical protein
MEMPLGCSEVLIRRPEGQKARRPEGQKPEARSQKPEARSQKPEARSQKGCRSHPVGILLKMAGTGSRDPVPAYRKITAVISVLVDEDAAARRYALRALPARTLTLIFIVSPPFVFSL